MTEEIDVESRTITMHLETKGSGAINAKLRAKVGRLERELSAALTTAECADNYSRMFEECAEERDQQAQRIGELEGLLREVAATLAWIAHGECRAIHDGPIMPSQMALDAVKAALGGSL